MVLEGNVSVDKTARTHRLGHVYPGLDNEASLIGSEEPQRTRVDTKQPTVSLQIDNTFLERRVRLTQVFDVCAETVPICLQVPFVLYSGTAENQG